MFAGVRNEADAVSIREDAAGLAGGGAAQTGRNVLDRDGAEHEIAAKAELNAREGDRLRIMGVFVYEDEPGVIGDPEVNETIYGRRTAL